ncbi:UbiA family prenyltransferase [Patescibacteria group bacterium]|nr:UbiA family prenyltransferase [Patescibacteria group bacterium]MBP9710442.1 UbiA family prenyltransferase [Patescibacteria group bacterium]
MTSFFTSLWQEIRWVVRVSRPRFWLYLFGPFLIGIVSTLRFETPSSMTFTNRLRTLATLGHILFIEIPPAAWRLLVEQPFIFLILLGVILLTFGYFLLPANLLIYGVNDLSDADTDAHNPKKDTYETRLLPSQRKRLIIYIILCQVPWLILSVWLLIVQFWYSLPAVLLFYLFILLGVFYSLPPIRAKARPFLDSASNIFYAFPGLMIYVFYPRPFPWIAFLAASCWCIAMHAYSAVPDIRADTRAGLQTIATKLGAYKTLILCSVLYGASSVLACFTVESMWLRYIFLLLGLGYVILVHISLTRIDDLMPVYKRFPLVNTLVGMILFFALLLG